MGRKLVLWLIVLTLTTGVKANIDSLKKVLGTPMPDSSLTNTYLSLGKAYMNISPDSALTYVLMAYENAKKANDLEKLASAANITGVVYLNKGQYDKALLYHLEASKLFEKTGNKRGVSFSYNNIGSVNFHTGKYDEALTYYKKSLALKLELNLEKEVSSTYVNLGNIFMKKNAYDSCIYYYLQALGNSRKNKDLYNESVSLMNLGEVYYDTKNYPMALNYYHEALAINEARNDLYHQANCYYAMGKIYTETKLYGQAETNLKKAYSIASKGDMKPMMMNIFSFFSKLYEATGDAQQALAYYKKYHALNDTLFNIEKANRIEELKAGYESELKDQKIKELNLDMLMAEQSAKQNKLFRNLLIVAFLLAGVTIGVLYRNIRLKQKTNRLLLEKNKQIEVHQQEIEEKNQALARYNKELMTENISVKYEVLKSKINPHFLFNSLSTLSTLIIKDQRTAIDFVGRFSKLYRSILKSGDNKVVSLAEELEIAGHYLYMQKMRFGTNLSVEINVPQTMMRNCVPPFTLQLLIENAIKHNIISEENSLSIEIKYEAGNIVISNNLQVKPLKEPSTGIGLQNITDRYRLLETQPPVFGVENGYYVARIPLLKPEFAA
ncbi:MAG: tetratricopeptide repeat protein [Bacteroidetes bacterium]|nr:MAG: tetratricopeptide repeat protein [Bacteroidota bacterium]